MRFTGLSLPRWGVNPQILLGSPILPGKNSDSGQFDHYLIGIGISPPIAHRWPSNNPEMTTISGPARRHSAHRSEARGASTPK